jgi:hypothetical protein
LGNLIDPTDRSQVVTAAKSLKLTVLDKKQLGKLNGALTDANKERIKIENERDARPNLTIADYDKEKQDAADNLEAVNKE